MNGLVLAGGHSQRMGSPKSLISYHAQAQFAHTADLLRAFCNEVYISCRAEQQTWFKGYRLIIDDSKYGDIGPLKAVLSAFDQHSDAWFVLGCDYPLLEKSDLAQLLQARKPSALATVFISSQTKGPEPLLGIYESSAEAPLRQFWAEGQQSLRHFLAANPIQRIVPTHPAHLQSVDTPAASLLAKTALNSMTTKSIQIEKFQGDQHWEAADLLAIEEPLEIRLEYGPLTKRKTQTISITMRTPGADADLALGFLFTEGILRQVNDVFSTKVWDDNAVTVSLQPEVTLDLKKLERHFYTSSSCGVCGKSSMEAVQTLAGPCHSPSLPRLEVPAEVIFQLPHTLREVQATFDATGGLHACAIFDPSGELLALREDVGRHNALDKLLGHYWQQGQVPLESHILLLSGRASFELLQKSAMAGIRFVCAVGAPSSLAVETATLFGITLVGFLREQRFNVYTRPN